jgi:hypothetical protein
MIYLIIALSIILLIVIIGYIRDSRIVKKRELEIKALEEERDEVVRKTEDLILSASEKILNKLKDS